MESHLFGIWNIVIQGVVPATCLTIGSAVAVAVALLHRKYPAVRPIRGAPFSQIVQRNREWRPERQVRTILGWSKQVGSEGAWPRLGSHDVAKVSSGVESCCG